MGNILAFQVLKKDIKSAKQKAVKVKHEVRTTTLALILR